VRAALGRVRKVTRGPKPALALHEVGLAPDLPAPLPTTEGVIQALALAPLRGRRVGVQLCGPNDALLSFLARSGALVQSVTPYLCAPDADNREVEALIAGLTEARIDAVAFTNAAQVEALYAAAAGLGLAAALDAGLAGTLVAAIGPTTAAPLRARGLEPQVTPRPFVMKRLAATVAAALGSDPRAQVEAGRAAARAAHRHPEHRELDRLATMLEEEGASTVRCPLMAIFDAPDLAPVERWLRPLAAGGFDDVIFFTGEGVRRLLESARPAGHRDEVLARSSGPARSPAAPSRPAPCTSWASAPISPPSAPTTGRGDRRAARGAAGRATVGCSSMARTQPRPGRLPGRQGALVLPVAPYRYAPPPTTRRWPASSRI
jgi:uroporphyrinogen-III synthase